MKVGIIGAGTMGSGIAQAFAQTEGYEVFLCDINEEFAANGKKKIAKGFEKRIAKGKMTYRYMEKEALYPFGFGLSYTSFEQGKTSADRMEIEAGGQIRIKTSVKNTGKFAGGQTIQVYVKALRDNTPNAQLKGLKKLSLQPGEEKEVEIVLTDKAFALYNEDAHFMLEAGDYEVSVGMQQPDRRSSELTGQTCSVLKVHCSETKEL